MKNLDVVTQTARKKCLQTTHAAWEEYDRVVRDAQKKRKLTIQAAQDEYRRATQRRRGSEDFAEKP